jgi:opacity protein-like surface antigen
MWIVAGGLALGASSAEAQEKRVNVSFGAGYTAPNSEVRDHLGDGYNITFGVQVNATPTIGIEGLYSFNGLGQKQISIPVSPSPVPGSSVPTDFFGDMNMQYGTAAVVLQKPDGQVRPYGLAGMGIYYRPIKVTTPGVGYIPGYCDPWWYVCYPGGFVPVENIVGERSSTDFGMVFGGGVNFNVFYTELRYHYIWGPKVQVPTGGTATDERKANGQFLALTFGLRF